MKNVLFVNPALIARITVKEQCMSEYKFVPETTKHRRFLPDKIIPAHYTTSYNDNYSIDKINQYVSSLRDGEPTYLKVGDEIWERSCVQIAFKSHTNIGYYSKYFDTIEESLYWTRNFLRDNGLSTKLIEIG